MLETSKEPMMCWWMMGGGFPVWMMVMGLLFQIVFWGAIIFLVVWAVRSFVARGRGQNSGNEFSILRERYARGEITREQYEQIRQDLES
jgi:putative membrane protein